MTHTAEDYIRGRVPRGASVLCPFHDDRSSSASVMPDTGRFYCFRCNIRADQVEMGKRLWFPDESWADGIRLTEALLREHRYPTITEVAADDTPVPDEDPRVGRMLTAWCRACAHNLQAHPDLLRRIREERALQNPIRLGLGLASPELFADFVAKMRHELNGWHGDGEALLARCGLVSLPDEQYPQPLERRYRLNTRAGGRWIIPEVRTDDPLGRRVVYFQARAQEKEHKYRYLNPRGMIRPIFGWESLARERPMIWLTEGVFDMLPLVEAGEAAVSVNGTSFSSRALDGLKEKANGRPVLIAFDNDPVGSDGIAPGLVQGCKQVAKLRAEGVDARLRLPPDPYKDLGQWIAAEGVDRVINHVLWEL